MMFFDTRSQFKMEVRGFIKEYHGGDAFLEMGYDDEGKFAHMEIVCGRGSISLPYHGPVYDSEGDEADKEVLIEELRTIIHNHNEKYSSV